MSKSNFVMESVDRELCGVIVKQRTKDEFMRLNDVLYIVDKVRLEKREERIKFERFLLLDNVKEFLKVLKNKIGTEPYIKGAKNRSGWIHPFFAIKILTHYNPAFEVEVYSWLWDYLIKNRVKTADSFNLMKGTLYIHTNNKSLFKQKMQKLCSVIKNVIGVEDWNKATERELELREYTHTIITEFTNTFESSELGAKFGIQALKKKIATPLPNNKENCAIIPQQTT